MRSWGFFEGEKFYHVLAYGEEPIHSFDMSTIAFLEWKYLILLNTAMCLGEYIASEATSSCPWLAISPLTPDVCLK